MISTTHVLLDLDGTLTDSEQAIGESLVHAFTACGYPAPTASDIRAMIGPPFEVSFPRFGVADSDIEEIIEAYRLRYEDTGLFDHTLYNGVIEMLDALQRDGHVLSVATAKPQHSAERILDHLGLTDYFGVVVGSTLGIGSARRTKAQVITHCLEQLGVSPHDRIALHHVLMVGDRDHDVEGALANSIECIGVSWGFGSHDELDGAGAVTVVDHPRDVAGAITAVYRSYEP